MTSLQSIKFIKKILKEFTDGEGMEKILSISNHSPAPENVLSNLGVTSSKDKYYRFTTKTLSISFLNKLQEHKKVENVFFNPTHTPPGAAPDSISFRYKVLIKYY
jgi:hypothetical protein